jgi:hypothetical protein
VRAASEEIGCSRDPKSVGISDTLARAGDLLAVADLVNLSPFAVRLYTKYLLGGYSPNQAYVKVFSVNMNFFHNAVSSLLPFRGQSAKEGKINQLLKVIDFLSGRKLRREATDKSKLDEFLSNLYGLGEYTRKATKAHDYVVSVWVDCPGYVLPHKYKEMGLPNLLENAIRQLEAKHGVTVQVSGFVGLLEKCSHQSGLWKPMMYLGRRRVEDTAQVYRAILEERPIPVTPSGDIPLGILSPTPVGLSRLALEYSEFFRQVPSITSVLDALQPIFRNFGNKMHNRFFHSFTVNLFFPADLPDMGVRATGFLSKLLATTTYIPRDSLADGSGDDSAYFEGLDHHQLIYRLIAISLGLEPRRCQVSGLKLMVFANRCIGLVAPSVLDGDGDVITVSTSSLRHQPNRDCLEFNGELMLEAVKIADEPFPRYRAAGIWVPHGAREVSKAGAYIEPEYPNALLG